MPIRTYKIDTKTVIGIIKESESSSVTIKVNDEVLKTSKLNALKTIKKYKKPYDKIIVTVDDRGSYSIICFNIN